ncbi:uncharacterized protein SAPINGB_P005108 [Magnusiomyces paraingens]|uniref:Uncharacterized protein n=1 Tax=Magnusiomyces paraingens TaxID=2606893 RepID=A0A5E8BXY0_9ASCO|nr:uncharacterized protein SAPINGB_P005108 [Saprochaete ingens]VVT56499.1 unnamed protein product [Saprochaete ingens]
MSVIPDTEPLWVEPPPQTPQQQTAQPQYIQPQAPVAQNGSHSIFSLKYYAQYFNVDTADVLQRSVLALNPFTTRQVFLFHTQDNPDPLLPDLYGPFWITSSVIFALFFASSVTGVIISKLVQHTNYEYRFDLLTGAASMLYSYTFLWPIGLWAAAHYLGLLTTQPNATITSFVSLYGYSNIIWIPVAILAVAPLDGLLPKFTDLFRWFIVLLGCAFSSIFLARNLRALFIPDSTAAVAIDRKPGAILLGLSLLVHGGISVAVKFLFFASHTTKTPAEQI